MSTAEQKILNNYLGLLERLAPKMKLRLIEKLKDSTKGTSQYKSDMSSAFGAWESEESAEEIIKNIRSSRIVNRDIEEL